MLFQRAGEWGEAAVSEVENEGGPFVQHRCSQKVLQLLALLWAQGRVLRPHGKSRGSGLTLKWVFTRQAEEKWMFYLKCYENCWEIMPVEGSSQSLFLFMRDKKACIRNKNSANPFAFILPLQGSWIERSLRNVTQFPSGIILFILKPIVFFNWFFTLCNNS